MAEHTKIEWCHHTMNFWVGCQHAGSPACDHCYAEERAKRYGENFADRRRTTPENWKQPFRWNRKAMAAGVREQVFALSLGDIWDNQVPIEWLTDALDVIRQCDALDWLLLTKRPQLIRRRLFQAFVVAAERNHDALSDWLAAWRDGRPPANVWLGTTVENQQEADRRIPDLLATPAAVRFLSCEPLLGRLDLRHVQAPRYVPEDHDHDWKFDALATGSSYEALNEDHGLWYDADGPARDTCIDWVIAGGEGGPKARPSHPDWFRSLRDQCQAAGVPFFFKQWGEWKEFGHDVDGPQIEEVDAGSDYADAIAAAAHRPAWITLAGDVYPDQRSLPEDVHCRLVERVGKASAGALLDGREHRDMPR